MHERIKACKQIPVENSNVESLRGTIIKKWYSTHKRMERPRLVARTMEILFRVTITFVQKSRRRVAMEIRINRKSLGTHPLFL